ncbi:MAG: transcriptional regulator, LysR family [Hyphomicrobiales bacterium]|nr:transcriptional regulator, LysR family [Hyphomicrobiales bacterium]
MDLRQLRYFVAVAEARNLVAAARTLALSQPALTKAIQALEQDCGSKLFERRSRGVVLTPVGEALSIRARLILSEVDRTRSELRALDNGQGGEIHIGALRSVANARLPDAAIEFSAERPSVTLNIEVDQNATLIEGLTRGRFDFIIGVGEGDLDRLNLDYEPLWSDRLVIVSRAGHPIEHLRRPAAADFARHSWIMPDARTAYRRRLEDYFFSCGVEPPSPAVVCGQLQFIRSMLLKSDHLALLPSDSIEFELNAGLLKAHVVNSDFLSRPIGLITRRDHVLTRASKEFLPILRATRAVRTMVAQ